MVYVHTLNVTTQLTHLCDAGTVTLEGAFHTRIVRPPDNSKTQASELSSQNETILAGVGLFILFYSPAQPASPTTRLGSKTRKTPTQRNLS